MEAGRAPDMSWVVLYGLQDGQNLSPAPSGPRGVIPGALARRFSRLASEPGIHNPQGVWWMRSVATAGEGRRRKMTDLWAQVRALRNWLHDGALPLWWELGAGRGRGGFQEAIGL